MYSIADLLANEGSIAALHCLWIFPLLNEHTYVYISTTRRKQWQGRTKVRTAWMIAVA